MTNEFTALREILERHGRSSEDGAAGKVVHAVTALRARIADVMAATAEASDATGQVTATASMGGRVESVYISPQAIRNLPGSALDRACLEAVNAARKAAATAFADRLEELTGQRPGTTEDHGGAA